MILQTDRRFTDPEIGPYGCQWMAQLFLLHRFGVEFSIEIIQTALSALRIQKASYQGESPDPANPIYVIGSQCFINNPEDIVTYFGLTYGAPARMTTPGYTCKQGEQEILQWKRPGWTHYCAGDGRGNVAYDPEGYSVTVREGVLTGKKIFTIIAPT